MNQIETPHFKHGWFLDAAENYCAAVAGLHDGLVRLPLRSRGFTGLRNYLDGYVHSADLSRSTVKSGGCGATWRASSTRCSFEAGELR
jgi:hypothetical protein